MKKTLLAICLALATTTAFAQFNQSDYPSVTFGLVGGVNAAFLKTKMPQGSAVSNNVIFPGSLGINADFRFNDYLSLRPGISYSGKGGDLQYIESVSAPFGTMDQTVDQKFALNYIEVPVNLIGHIPVTDSFNILIGAGPYVAMGLSAKTTTTVGDSDPETDKLEFGNNGDFKSTDLGAATMLGFETSSGLIFGINYDIGLTNIAQNGDSNNSLKTGTIYASIGFSFH
ncbi:porin family protein [Mucilaginibacter sp. McL0603]|uniref:porin family protein n=1 Tax=Mucilaginibacter sp. McL0603 TaxID=3415670 RepID=UPI003CF33927